jgi:crotonobetainyl-CoA:carnitine CoA-transferase CaiB-like acyl-CoA transferase
MTLPYEDVMILDFTQLEQGPSGTLMLADFGARVIKVERIDVGEVGRDQTPDLRGMSCHWAANNRNKLSLSLELKRPEARDIVLRLARDADIVASSFRPGVMERLGFGYDDLRAVNPRIICAYASGYGQRGPYRDLRGQDLAAQAIGGVMDLTGDADGPPTPIGTFGIDYLAAMQFAMGMMAALAARERTGKGQIVDTCLLNAAVTLHHQEATAFLNTGRRYPRPAHGIAHAYNTPLYARYRCADDTWLVLIGEFYISEPWPRIVRALGLDPTLADDPRFQSVAGLREHAAAAHDLLAGAFGQLTRHEAMARLEAEDVLCAPVNGYPEVFSDPQVRHNEMVIEAEHEHIGPYRLVGMPVKLSATPATLRLPPPTVGEHNEAVLAAIGCTEDEIARLREAGVVGSEMVRQRLDGTLAWAAPASEYGPRA